VARENLDTRLSLCRPHVPHGRFKGIQYSSVGMVIRLWPRRSGVGIPVGARDFFFVFFELSALGPTNSPIQWVAEIFLRV
jgi:hypothetical protein